MAFLRKCLILFQLCLLSIRSASGSTAIFGFGCKEMNKTQFLSPGEDYILYCVVDNTGVANNILTWTTPKGNDLFVSSSSTPQSSEGFTIDLVDANNVDKTVNASLMFTASKEIDEMTVKCRDNQNQPDEVSCTLLIFTVPNRITQLMSSDITYKSVYLSWSAPNDTGGYNSVNYIITVTPLDDSDPWNITTTDNSTSYNVTGLMFGQSYNFTVRASNSIGLGEKSNIINVTLPGEAPPSVNVTVCLDYNSTGTTELSVSWKPCPPIFTNVDATPPIDNYTVSISGITGYAMDVTICSHIQSVNEGMYTVTVTANNIVGSSEKTMIADFNARWLQNVYKDINVASSQAKIEYIGAVVCVELMDLTAQLIYNDDAKNITVTTTKSYATSTTDSFILSSIQPGATISYTLQVIDTDSNIVGSTSSGSFVFPSPSMTPPPPTTTVLVMTTSSIMNSVTITVTTTTTTIPVATTSPPADLSSTIPWAAVGGGIACGLIFVLILVILFFVIGIVCYKKKSKHNVNFGKGGGRKDSDGPIALVEKKSAVPETGQALYQNPTTIERQQAPTGDLYAMPDKGKGKGSRRQVPTTPSAENATYQDPSTIERQQAPTGDLYAMPEKKPKYSEVQKQNTGVLYADVEVGKARSDQPRGKLSEVLYSDVKS